MDFCYAAFALHSPTAVRARATGFEASLEENTSAMPPHWYGFTAAPARAESGTIASSRGGRKGWGGGCFLGPLFARRKGKRRVFRDNRLQGV